MRPVRLALLVACAVLLPAEIAGAATGDDWLGEVNKYRVATGLHTVVEEPTWTQGLSNHVTYLDKTPDSYFTGQYASRHSENPASPYYTQSGALEAQYSDIGFGSSPVDAIDGWWTAPFHAIGMLRAQLTRVAFAMSAKKTAALDIIQGVDLNQPAAAAPILFPGPGMTTDLARYSGGESPDPLETCGLPASSTAGLPLIAMLPAAPSPALTAELIGPDSRTSAPCVVDQHTFRTSDSVYGPTGASILADDRAVVLIPRAPLDNGSYTAKIHQPGQPDVAWSFIVSAPPGRLPATSKLSFHHVSTRVNLSWAKITGALIYRVTITISGHSRVVKTGSTHIVFHLARHKRARVAVRGIGAAGTLGRATAITVR